MPIALTRTHRAGFALQGVRPFGVGSAHLYELFLFPDLQFQEIDLILPDGGRVHYPGSHQVQDRQTQYLNTRRRPPCFSGLGFKG